MSQGRWKEAEELFMQCIEASPRVLGHEHPYTLTSMSDLAKTFCYQGRLKEAEKLEVQVIATRKRVLGLEHLHTGSDHPENIKSIYTLRKWQE